MNRSIILLASVAVFAVCYFCEMTNIFHHVSPETVHADRGSVFVVKHGVSEDGHLAILPIDHVSSIAGKEKILNHLRNLRVWQGASRDGVSTTFFVEQFRPHQFFEVRITFPVSPETLRITWTSPTAFMFCGESQDEQLMRYEIDLHRLVLVRSAVENSSCVTRLSPKIPADE